MGRKPTSNRSEKKRKRDDTLAEIVKGFNQLAEKDDTKEIVKGFNQLAEKDDTKEIVDFTREENDNRRKESMELMKMENQQFMYMMRLFLGQPQPQQSDQSTQQFNSPPPTSIPFNLPHC